MNTRLGRYWAAKQAGLTADSLGSLGLSSKLVGPIHGWFTDDLNIPDPDKEVALSFVPGVGSNRIVRRARRVREETAPGANFQTSRVLSDAFSPVGNALLMTILGGVIGGAAGIRDDNVFEGIGIGAASGFGISGISNIAGSILAATKRKRTKEEQAKAESKPGLFNWLIPGRGAYENWKRIGASTHFEGKPYKKK